MKKLVIKIKWGGLGDHLFHTPIPRIAKQQGYDKVYISNHSDYKRPDIKRFIWESNPFVDGFSDEDCSIYPQFGEVEEGMNILDKLILWWGLKDDGLRFREPEVYYSPKPISKLRNAVIFDPNFGTPVGHPHWWLIERYFEQSGINITHQMKPYSMGKMNTLWNKPNLVTTSMEHFCDIIFSCKRLICFNTGTAPLAAALGKSTTVLITGAGLPMFRHSKLHDYVEIK